MEVIIDAKKSSVNILKESATDIEIGGSYTQSLIANDYEKLNNKPSIEGVELIKNKTFEELGAISLTNMEIENLINSQV